MHKPVKCLVQGFCIVSKPVTPAILPVNFGLLTSGKLKGKDNSKTKCILNERPLKPIQKKTVWIISRTLVNELNGVRQQDSTLICCDDPNGINDVTSILFCLTEFQGQFGECIYRHTPTCIDVFAFWMIICSSMMCEK